MTSEKKPQAGKIALFVIAFIPVTFCTLLPALCLLQIWLLDSTDQASAEKVYSQTPDGFSESDLIGTWRAMAENYNFTIREDGKYKQNISEKEKNFTYESDWKPWRLSYSEKGLPYLHLEGFMMCAYWDAMDCRTQKTNITPVIVGDTQDPFTGEYFWYDDCQKKWVDTPGEGVFMVIKTTAYYPRQINLVPFTKSSDGGTGPSYSLREPR